jgi:hypothetical protein
MASARAFLRAPLFSAAAITAAGGLAGWQSGNGFGNPDHLGLASVAHADAPGKKGALDPQEFKHFKLLEKVSGVVQCSFSLCLS